MFTPRVSGLKWVLSGFLIAFSFAAYVACDTQMAGLGPQGPEGPQGPAGPAGAMGAAGQDGSLRAYGNGSAGAKVVAADEDWQNTPPTNLMFTDFTVNAGVNLDIPSGTIIRCTGTFTNNGTIRPTFNGATGGSMDGNFSGMVVSGIAIPSTGVARSAPTTGELGDNTQFRQASGGASGLISLQGRQLLHPGTFGGGGGMGTFLNGGGDGGGSITVMAKSSIINGATGLIDANASDGSEGCGGGGGGIIILASMGSVTNNGVLRAAGGNGGNSNTVTGPGGGGGGGIIHMLAPTVTQGGGSTAVVTGGTAGTAITNSITSNIRHGGGGGGACRGNGGSGGAIDMGATVTPEPSDPGGAGEVYISQFDPTPLL